MTGEQPLPPRAVVGAEALAALAVPVRYAILSHLLDAGPRTASECADVVGESPSNCSWHLRALAAVGLVQRSADRAGDARRRPWEAAAVGFDFEGSDTPVGRLAGSAVESLVIDRHAELLRRYLLTRAALPAEWTAAARLTGYSLLLTAAELAELGERIDALVRPYVRAIRQDGPPGSEVVHVGVQAFLNPDLAGRSR